MSKSPCPVATDTVEWLGVSYKTILPAADTGGRMSIVESVSPDGSGPPRHIHHEEDETFVLLTGRCTFWVSGVSSDRGPGESVFIPRGTEHTFRVVGGQSCQHLVILTPGGFEAFFKEMAERQYRIPEDMVVINETAKRHNLSFTGPPLDAV